MFEFFAYDIFLRFKKTNGYKKNNCLQSLMLFTLHLAVTTSQLEAERELLNSSIPESFPSLWILF